MLRNALKPLTLLDWLTPTLNIAKTFTGQRPVYVADAHRYKAAKVLGGMPSDFDLMQNAWIWMVDDYDDALAALSGAGVKCW